MDTSLPELRWPPRPYFGLDFYREEDGALFRERDAEVRECANLLLGFGVKLLLLHGSSGCGKSSFLRAGQIPHLKRANRSPSNLLSGPEGVIRCTADPLNEITRALLYALGQETIFSNVCDRPPAVGGFQFVEDEVRRDLKWRLERLLMGEGEELGAAVLDILAALSAQVPSKLVLVLDQAEEVLTRTITDRGATYDPGSAFFRFLENIYLRNLDVRLVITLRTEYYGRFRDELQISDDRLAHRPESGGIQPFLLRSVRDEAALMRIIQAPTLAVGNDGKKVYDFNFENKGKTVENIVKDLLREFPASVTPALQVVCATLYSGLRDKHKITFEDYRKLGGAGGIVRSYVEDGIRAIAPWGRKEVDGWHLLLHSLVSRQGGGTVVSLTEPRDVLCARAREFRIAGDVAPKLGLLTGGTHPLLRGEPTEKPSVFGLKHDVLAVILSRWYDEYGGAVKARGEERRKWHWIMATSACIVLALLLTAAYILIDRSRAAAMQTKNVEFKVDYAAHAPVSNFRRSLMLLVYNLQDTARPKTLFDWISGSSRHDHEFTLKALRQLAPRVPWFAGRFQAAGLDPVTGAVALLQEGAVEVLRLPNGDSGQPEPVTSERLPLPAMAVAASRPPYAAGFVTGLGPVAFVGGNIYFWNEEGQPQTRGLWEQIKAKLPGFAQGWPPLVEFSAGKLVMSKFNPGAKLKLQILRLAAEDLRTNPVKLPEEVLPMLFERELGKPTVMFSDAPDLPPRYAALDQAPQPLLQRPHELAHADAITVMPAQLDLLFGDTVNADHILPARAAVADIPSETGLAERQSATLAFVANRDAVALKLDTLDFYILDVGKATPLDNTGYVDPPWSHVTIQQTPETIPRLGQSGVPWVPPPLAAIQIGNHWRVAWLTRNGISVVESSDEAPHRATPLPGSPLLGEPLPRGSKLKFTASGDFLVHMEQQQFASPAISLRIWDLRPVWQAWSNDKERVDEAKLQILACRVVRADGRGGMFEEDDQQLFQIRSDGREPCPDVRSSGDE